jgi:hypothetical protein
MSEEDTQNFDTIELDGGARRRGFQVFMTPLGFPDAPMFMGIPVTNLSEKLRENITNFDFNYKTSILNFHVKKEGLYPHAFIQALQTNTPKEFIVFLYDENGVQSSSIVFSVFRLVDYDINSVLYDNMFAIGGTVCISVKATAEFRVR